MVVLGKKRDLPTIAALRDMMRHPRNSPPHPGAGLNALIFFCSLFWEKMLN